MQERFELLFLVYADEKYELFVIPYIWFALSTNPESAVEVVLKDKKGFEEKRYESLKLLKKQFGDRFRLTQSTYGNSNIIPNTIRFIETPTIKAKYLYIGDIDILVLQNVIDVHTEIMEVNGMSYSNKIRNRNDAKLRITGLHFCKYDDYYPLPSLDGISLETENDEHVLYLLLRAKNIDINYENRTRPLCGLHVSLNRDPIGRTSGFCNKNFKTTNNVKWGGIDQHFGLLDLIETPDFMELYPLLDYKFRFLLMLAEGYMRGIQEEVSQLSLCYGVDRSSYTTNTTTTRHECLDSIEKALVDGNTELAELLARDALIKFPYSIALMVKLSEVLFKNGDFDGVARYIKQIKTIDEELQYLKGTPFFKSNRNILASIIER